MQSVSDDDVAKRLLVMTIDNDNCSIVFVVLLAESYDNVTKRSSGECTVESESATMKQSTQHHNVEDLCQQQPDTVCNEQLQQLIISNNQRVNFADSGCITSADSKHLISADNGHVNFADSECITSADSRHVNSADSGHVDPSECLVSSGLPIKLPEFEHFLSDMPHRLISRPITELGADTDSDADQLETELADFREVPARFLRQDLSKTESLPALSADEGGCCNKSPRNSHKLTSHGYKSTDTMNLQGCVRSNKKDCSDDSHSDQVSFGEVSMLEPPNSRMNVASSDILLQLTSLSDQLAAQVTNI